MPTYISLMKFTKKAITGVSDMPEAIERGIERLQKVGGAVEHLYLVMGDYDMVGIWTAPDDEAAMGFLLEIGAAGYVRTTTLQAFTMGAFGEMVSKLPEDDD